MVCPPPFGGVEVHQKTRVSEGTPVPLSLRDARRNSAFLCLGALPASSHDSDRRVDSGRMCEIGAISLYNPRL